MRTAFPDSYLNLEIYYCQVSKIVTVKEVAVNGHWLSLCNCAYFYLLWQESYKQIWFKGTDSSKRTFPPFYKGNTIFREIVPNTETFIENENYP